jgi:hypothetical protein
MRSAWLTIVVFLGLLAGGAAARASTLYSGAVLGDNPIGYWRLGDLPGITWDQVAADETLAHPGTYSPFVMVGQPGAIASDPNTAAFFDGSGAQVAIDGINLANQSFTLQIWAEHTDIGESAMLIGQGPVGAATSLQFGFVGGFDPTFTFAFNGSHLDVQGASFVQDSLWHQWVGTFDATTLESKIYVDGFDVASGTASGPYTGTGTLDLAPAGPGGFRFFGTLDEAAIFGTALDPFQIEQLYQLGAFPDPAPPPPVPEPGSLATAGALALAAAARGLRARRRAR